MTPLADLPQKLSLSALQALMAAAFAAGAQKSGGRATHRIGVGARGTLVLRSELALPPHRELRPGRQLDVVLRHANLNLEDDLAADFRGAALQLTRGREHVLDLLLNTGRSTVWRTAAHFAERMKFFAKGDLAGFYAKYPDAAERFWDGQRRAPERYDDLRYHSKLGLRYVARDGHVFAARFRLSPADDRPPTGLPTAQDRAAGPVDTARRPDQTGALDAVRQRFLADLARGPIRYRLDIQLRCATDDPRHAVHDATVAWPEAWQPLADLTLTEAVPAADLEPMQFRFGRGPRTLGVFPAARADDLTSLGALRSAVYPLAARARG